MTFTDFLTKYNGQSKVGNTTENKGQCVGLSAVWIEALGLPHVWGDACDMFVNADEQFFTKILNTPDAIPQAGDIIIWSKAYNGTAGHTGIATGTADLKTFECFEQNDPTGSNCHLKTYKNYNYITGWLRPKSLENNSTELNQCINDRNSHYDDLIAIAGVLKVSVNRSLIIAEIEKLITLEDQYNQKDKQLAESQAQISELQGKLQDTNNNLLSLSSTNETLTKKLSDEDKKIQDALVENASLSKALQDLKAQITTPVYKGWKKALINFIINV
jgi:hypothetical protein